MNRQDDKRLSLSETLPAFAVELQELLVEKGEPDLAAQVPTLSIFDRCRCGDDFCCGTFYTQPKPNSSFGPGHRNVRLLPHDGALLILDVVAESIVAVEILDRPEIREELHRLLP